MAREGSRKRQSDEYIGTNQASYAEAIQSSIAMGQTLEAWIVDAIAFHAYHCEVVRLAVEYEAAEFEARQANNPTPDRSRFQPRRQRPTITEPQAGKGSGPTTARQYRP